MLKTVMNKLTKSEKGFSVFEVILAIAVIVAIAVAGYLVDKDHHNSASTQTKLSSKNMTINKKNSTSSSKPSVVEASSVTKFMTDFYSKYTECFNNGNPNQTCTMNLVSQYGTTSLMSYYMPSTGTYASDPIDCAQATPTSFVVSGITVNSDVASGNVIEKFGTDTKAVKFAVINQSGSIKLNTITCAPPLTPSPIGP
jgi:cell division protein FtsL